MTTEVFGGLKIAILVDVASSRPSWPMPARPWTSAGAETRVVSPKDQWVRGWNSTEWGDELRVDVSLDQARPYDFDALIVPGGVPAAEALRMQTDAVRLLAAGFVQAFLAAQKPVAVISYGPWTVIEADTEWVEEDVVVDGNLVSSRMIGLFGRPPGRPDAHSAPEEQSDLNERAAAMTEILDKSIWKPYLDHVSKTIATGKQVLIEVASLALGN